MELLVQRACASVTLVCAKLLSRSELMVSFPPARKARAPRPHPPTSEHVVLSQPFDLCGTCLNGGMWKFPLVYALECFLIMAFICMSRILNFGFAIGQFLLGNWFV